MEVWGDKIIMELNDSVKNGDVETGWDSSEVGADAEIEYVPLNEGRKFLLPFTTTQYSYLESTYHRRNINSTGSVWLG